MLKQGVKLQIFKKNAFIFLKIIIFAVYKLFSSFRLERFCLSFRLERSGMEKSPELNEIPPLPTVGRNDVKEN